MKKPRQKTARSTHLQAQDLTVVRGGGGSQFYFAIVGGGIAPDGLVIITK